MTCPNCLRDVPKLVGPDYVCPDCYLVASEDLIPSLFGGVVDEGDWDDAVPDYVEDFMTGCSGGPHECDAAWLLDDDTEAIGTSEDRVGPRDGRFPPTFGGRPRF